MRALPEPDRRAGYKAQEKKLARVIGGRQTAGSGNSKRVSHKGDAVSELTRAEGKTTNKKSLSVKREWLPKIRREARETDKVPALMFGFDADERGVREDWVAFPEETAEALLKIADAVQKDDYGRAREWLGRIKA